MQGQPPRAPRALGAKSIINGPWATNILATPLHIIVVYGSVWVGLGRFGSGRIGSRFGRILAGRVGVALRFLVSYMDYFLVSESI